MYRYDSYHFDDQYSKVEVILDFVAVGGVSVLQTNLAVFNTLNSFILVGTNFHILN